ncbi:MAG: hypothetical protein AAGJ93_02650 [Bacteroidota bacterium]
MEKLTQILLIIHVIAGFTAFLIGPLAIFSDKFGRSHRTSGRIFSIAMALVFITSIVVCIYKQNAFLFMVAFFSFYSVVSGVRILKLKRLGQQHFAKWYDWSIHAIFLLTCIAFLTYAILLYNQYGFNVLSVLCTLFAIGGFFSVRANVKPFLRKVQPAGFWLTYHQANMIGAYIATVTAFSSQQLHFMPTILQWTWPTLLIMPISTYINRKYKSHRAEMR